MRAKVIKAGRFSQPKIGGLWAEDAVTKGGRGGQRDCAPNRLDGGGASGQTTDVARQGFPYYAQRVFWFWWLIYGLMVLLDAAWWALAMRLAKDRFWRVAVSVFMAAQLAGHISLLAGFGWPRHAPKAALVAVLLWHLLLLPLLLAICLPVLMARAGARHLRRGRTRGGEPEVSPEAGATNTGSLTRRKFLGNCAAMAPPLLTLGLTGAAQAQLDQFRVRRFTLTIPALPPVLDGITIAHVTDMHVGGLTDKTVLQEMVKTTNALEADLVMMTGDLINDSLGDLEEGLALVKAMHGRYGLWMVEGNHDLFDNAGNSSAG